MYFSQRVFLILNNNVCIQSNLGLHIKTIHNIENKKYSENVLKVL